MSSLAIEIKYVHAWYGESHILHGINFSVKAGEVVTLLGRNGAGRTSTLRAILGLTGKRTVLFEFMVMKWFIYLRIKLLI